MTTMLAPVTAFEFAARLLELPPWRPYPWQTVPSRIATHGAFLIEGGRGIGKTEGCARYVDAHVQGPPCDPRIPGGHRVAIIAPTLDDAAESCVTGPSGLRTINPAIQLRTALGGSKAIWPNGAEAKLFSGQTEKDTDRLRAGGNRCLAFVEEAAAIPHLDTVLKQARYGLRVGDHPHIVASSTPRNRKAYREFRDDPTTIRTHGTTEQATHLDELVRARLYADYAGTRLGRQELSGELLDDIEGALWSLQLIDDTRILAPAMPADIIRTVVAVDPAVTSGPNADQTGIIAAAAAAEPYHPDHPTGIRHGYVLADESGRYTPDEWARKVCILASKINADAIVVEDNQGGEVWDSMIRTAWTRLVADRVVRGACPAVRRVHARLGKRLRAEPVAQWYEQGRVHHVGTFDLLEDQQTTWTPGDDSPDRLDALVHGLTDLLGGESQQIRQSRSTDRRLAGRGR